MVFATHAKITLFTKLMMFAMHWPHVEAGIHLGSSLRGFASCKAKVSKQLKTSLGAVVSGGDERAMQRIARIEKTLWHSFQAMPKDRWGQAMPRTVRHLVHSFFAEEHGWLLSGLEPHGMQVNMTAVHQMGILQEKAPAVVDALLETGKSQFGLEFSDVVSVVAAVERLVLDESMALLRTAYKLNNKNTDELLDERALLDVLESYLFVFEQGAKANVSAVEAHQITKKLLAERGGSWADLTEFAQDAQLNYIFSHSDQLNPFMPLRFSFLASSQIVEDLALSYGQWQDAECRRMKSELVKLDPDSTGRVPLSTFYSQPKNAVYQFVESVDYLREVGAIEESSVGGPSVRIANYILSPTNCIATSSFFSVCCLSDCGQLMGEVEHMVQAPTASPQILLGIVGNLSLMHFDGEQVVTAELEAKLHTVAAHHAGTVPLHGRLFAQWMHFAFPLECPYPHVLQDSISLSPASWSSKKSYTSTEEQRQKFIEENAYVSEQDINMLAVHWTDEEVMPLQEPHQARSFFGFVVRGIVQLVMLVLVLKTAAVGLAAVKRIGFSRSKPEKELSCETA
jgi:hypothetical protein